jgi:ankyrin repeat protein
LASQQAYSYDAKTTQELQLYITSVVPAVKIKDIQIISLRLENLIKLHADPNIADPQIGLSALHIAACINDIGLTSLLLEHGAHIDQKTTNGTTPLLVAVLQKSYEVMQYLIIQKADINAVTVSKNTLLHCAISNNLYISTRILLKAGADVDKQNSDGNTAAHLAVWNMKILQALLAQKPDLNKVNNNDKTPFMLAATSKNKYILDILIAHGSLVPLYTINQPTKDLLRKKRASHILKQQFPLQYMIKIRHSDCDITYNFLPYIIEEYRKNNRSLNEKDSSNVTPLYIAIALRDEYAARLLLEHGANPLSDHDCFRSLELIQHIPEYKHPDLLRTDKALKQKILHTAIGHMCVILAPLTRLPHKRVKYDAKREHIPYTLLPELVNHIAYWAINDE